jgi:hypothetical protein
MTNITNSQVADRGSAIVDSKMSNTFSINKIRRETVIISFIVGFLSSLLASYIYQILFK